MIYLNKVLPLLVSPLSIAILLLILNILTGKLRYTVMSLSLLYLSSLPILSDQLIRALEGKYIPQSIDKVEKRYAVVILGGMVRRIQHDEKVYYEFNEAVDRIHTGIKLIKAKKASKLILTRAKLPWDKGKSEGEFLADFARENGVNKNTIILTRGVENTHDEAKAVAEILNSNRDIILVTSAFHMQRAQNVFESISMDVLPYPVDFLSSAKKSSILDYLPQASAFYTTSFFMLETLGRVVYSFK